MRFVFTLLLFFSLFHVQLLAQTSGCYVNYINPANGSKINSLSTATLVWQNIPGATYYDVFVGTDNSYGLMATLPPGTNGTTTYTLNNLQGSTTYKWYPVAKNAAGGYVQSCFPVPASFTTADSPVPPACTYYVEPQNGAVLTSPTTALLRWAPAAITTSYDLYLWTGDIAPTQPIAIVAAGTTTYNATGLLAGTTYHFYLTPRNAAGPATNCIYTQVSFTTAYAIPVNDNCEGALEVIPGTANSCGPTVVSTTNGATASNVPACTGSAEDDVWFKFTPTSKRNKVSVTVYPINPVIELFSGNCSSLTSMGCYTTTAPTNPTSQSLSAELPALVPGQTYYYRVYGSGANSVRTIVNTCIAGIPDPPSNDECSGALLLTANADTSTTYSYTGATGYASQSMVSCVDPDYIASDVWFKFVATAATQKISVAPVSLYYYDYAFQVFGGSCGNLTPLACVNNGSYSQPDTTVLNNLIIGNTYYMRVWDYHGDGAPQGAFKIVINTPAPGPVNDDCSGALLVTPGPDPYCGNNNVIVSGDNTGATQSMPGCAGTAEDDIWFKFIAASNRHKISVGVSAAINPVLEVFSGNCSSLTSLGCFSSKSISPSSVSADMGSFIPGQTYYYRVYGSGSNNERATINTCIATVPPAPLNDECSSALQLTANKDTSSVYSYTNVTGYPTQSLVSCTDPNSLAADIWFKFTAVATSHKIKVASLFSSAYPAQDYSFQVFGGNCGNLTSLACVNSYGDGQPDSVTLNNLTIGNTYYMRLWNFNGDVAPNQAFKIIINTTQILPPPPVNDDCTGALVVVPGPEPTCQSAVTTTADNIGATQSMPGCTGTAEDDIWFKFTATSNRHKITATLFSSGNPVLEVFTGDCSSLTSLGCFSSTLSAYPTISADLASFVPGQTYYYRVYGSGSNTVREIIHTCIATVPPAPVNDECSGALQLTANADTSSAYSYTGVTGYASQSLISCTDPNYLAKDVWFKFTAVATSQKIAIASLYNYDYSFQVFSGTCDHLVSLACVNTGSYGQPDTTILNNLTIGNTYYMRVYDYHGDGSPSAPEAFKIVINTTQMPAPPPTNGLQAVYYNGISLSGTPLLTRVDTSINFELTYSKQPLVLSPAPGIVPEDLFSVRWTGQIQPLYSETYTFYTLSDDGIRLWVNGVQLVDDWMNQGTTEKSGSITLVAGQKYDIVVEYYENTGEAVAKLYWSSASTPKALVPSSQLFPSGSVTVPVPAHGLKAVYYNNATLTEPGVLTRTDTTINNDFVYVSPAPGFVNLENYSVRWTGQVQPLYSETYTFYVNTDDGVRLWVNGVLLIDNWVNQGATEKSGSITLTAGQKYDIVMEYFQGTGFAVSKLLWSSPGTAKAIIPASQLYPPAAAGSRLMYAPAVGSISPSTTTGATLPVITAAISPNPVSRGQLAKLQISTNKNVSVAINTIGSSGNNISARKLTLVAGVNNCEINTSGLATGLYIITINGNNRPINLKLIVK